MFGGFTEGLQLFASFAMLMNFPRFNKMKGMGQIVSWSVRDESLHCEGITKLFHAFVKETRLPDQGGEGRHHRLLPEDRAAGRRLHRPGLRAWGRCRGMTAKEIKRYIRYIADWRLGQLGCPIYMVEDHPLPWLRRC
jgi:ribonucleoside-diphosphate reductase beta chain